jgi:hypothetical protein
LVIADRAPFAATDTDALCDNLVSELQRVGADAEALHVPFTAGPSLIDAMLIARSLRIPNVDRLIALGFPSYLVPHPNKVLWLVQPPYGSWGIIENGHAGRRDAPDKRIRNAIRQANYVAFAEARAIYASSQATADRVLHENGFATAVLALPRDGALPSRPRTRRPLAPAPTQQWRTAVERLLA